MSAAPSFDATVERLRLLRETDDQSRWFAGDTVVAYLGRNSSDDQAETLGKLAAHSGFERGGLRERYHCSLYFPEGTRRWDNAVSWSHYNRARRGVDFEQACEFLAWAEKRTASVARFERALRGWKRLMGRADTAPALDALLDRAVALLDRAAALDLAQTLTRLWAWRDGAVEKTP